MVEGLFARKSVSLTGAAVFGGLAALTTVMIPARIQPFFPIMPFLRFDPAEIFSVLAFLIFGPVSAVIAYEELVRPILYQALHLMKPERPRIKAEEPVKGIPISSRRAAMFISIPVQPRNSSQRLKIKSALLD